MRALYLQKGKIDFLTDYALPERRAGHSLVRVLLAGICSTDLELLRGYAGFQGIPGHEFVGVVEKSDRVELIGQRVVGRINIGCMNCRTCLSRGPEHCPERSVLGIIDHDGAFADYLTLPDVNLLPVPDEIENERAVFTEPLAAALRIMEQVKIRPTAEIAVVGPGKLGMLIGQVLQLHGAHVTMLGRRKASLELPANLGIASMLVEQAEDSWYDIVVEATGNEAGLAHSLRIIRPEGLLVLKSTFAGSAHVDLSKIVVDEISVVGSRCGPFEPALRLLVDGKIAVEAMIEARYSIEDGVKAFERAAEPGVRKVLLHF
jgi:threonine dehydrogenase-like Zn-dependent dehydrogenase